MNYYYIMVNGGSWQWIGSFHGTPNHLGELVKRLVINNEFELRIESDDNESSLEWDLYPTVPLFIAGIEKETGRTIR